MHKHNIPIDLPTIAWKKHKLCEHPKILIVDDEGMNFFAMTLLLKFFGYKCDSATNGKMAIEMIKKS